MNKRELRSIVTRLNKHKLALAKHRDELRELMSEIEEISDISADAAIEIGFAIERLSEQL